ncbi:MAG: right-handed parallel beta-helix repeat-containing protein [Nanoarchaeota archaeon]|nr:right-handed parallel beta-helix repeat-containing protein [Nanoarchaeota archaeon]
MMSGGVSRLVVFVLLLVLSTYYVAAQDLAVLGTREGVKIVDVTNPLAPSIIGATAPDTFLRDAIVVGNTAYFAGTVLLAVDISNPTNPTIMGSMPSDLIWGMDIQDNYAYLATDDHGLRIVDISDPTSMNIVGTYADCSQNKDVTVRDNHAFLACANADLTVIDISNKANPRLVGKGYSAATSPSGVAVQGPHAFIVSLTADLVKFDINDLTASTFQYLNYYESKMFQLDVKAQGDYLYVGLESGLDIVRISDLKQHAKIEIRGSIRELDINGNYAYLADEYYGFKIADIKKKEIISELNIGSVLGVDFVRYETKPAEECTLCHDACALADQVTANSESTQYYNYYLSAMDCDVELTLTAVTGSFMLATQEDSCGTDSDVISVSEGQTRTISKHYLESGSYGVSVQGSGQYILRKDAVCHQQLSQLDECRDCHRSCLLVEQTKNEVPRPVYDGTMFVSSSAVSGIFGGLRSADRTCMGSGYNVDPEGNYVAILSDSKTNAKDRLPNVVYKTLDGKIVANSKADLFDGNILSPIELTSQGVSPLKEYVWTGSDEQGRLTGKNCADWTIKTDSKKATIGLIGETGPDWINKEDLGCGSGGGKHFYCVRYDGIMTNNHHFILDENDCDITLILTSLEEELVLSASTSPDVCSENYEEQITVPAKQSGSLELQLTYPGTYYLSVHGEGGYQLAKEQKCGEKRQDKNQTNETIDDSLPDIFKLSEKTDKRDINAFFTSDHEYSLNIDKPIDGLALTADIEFTSFNGLVRVVLVDTEGKEYLVYETYTLLAPSDKFKISDVCEETCELEGVIPSSIKLQIEDARVVIRSVDMDDLGDSGLITGRAVDAGSSERDIAQEDYKIQRIRDYIDRNNLDWTAGRTPISDLTYEEKKNLLGVGEIDELPNLQGFEYYTGGVFDIILDDDFVLPEGAEPPGDYTPPEPSLPGSNYPSGWDWRDRHGEWWPTSIKDQRQCGSCWAFAATGATELAANLYFNQHIDFNMAEQDALSCSGAGSCAGGWPWRTLDYYTTTGVVNEGCFPYTATNNNCANKCSNPSEKLWVAGRVPFYGSQGEEVLKGHIVNGAVSGGIYSWSHAMSLEGWKTDPNDGKTIWIFKNSWGSGYGDHGYAYVKTPISNIGWTHAVLAPITTLTGDYEIQCNDNDHDTYCNWGISPDMPASCSEYCKSEPDCDDSDPRLTYFEDDYVCHWLEGDELGNTCMDCGDACLLRYSFSGEIEPQSAPGEMTGMVISGNPISSVSAPEFTLKASDLGMITGMAIGAPGNDSNDTNVTPSPLCGGTVSGKTDLTEDMYCEGVGLRATGSEFTINCHGHTISGPGTYGNIGIEILGQTITVRDCNFEGLQTGVYVNGGSGSLVLDNTFNDVHDGVKAQFTSYMSVMLNDFNGCNAGVNFSNSVISSRIRDNTIRNSIRRAIFLGISSTFAEIYGNTIQNNNEGIMITANAGTRYFHNNIISGNSGRGVFVARDGIIDGAYNNTFENNGQNAYENVGVVTTWDSGSEGNYWDDFSQNSGYPNVYYIEGGGAGVDNYPNQEEDEEEDEEQDQGDYADYVIQDVGYLWTDASGFGVNVDGSGAQIVWDERYILDTNYGTDIFYCDLETGTTTQITEELGYQITPAISGDHIVWHNQRSADTIRVSTIHMHDLTTGQNQLIHQPASNPTYTVWTGDGLGIFDNIVYWTGASGSSLGQLRTYDVSTGQTTLVASEISYHPHSDGDQLIWAKYVYGSANPLMVKDFSTGQISEVAAGENPRISGNYVTYGNMLLNRATGVTQAIPDLVSGAGNPKEFMMESNWIVFLGNPDGNWDVFLYDLNTGSTTQITSTPQDESKAIVAENRLYWRSVDEQTGEKVLRTWGAQISRQGVLCDVDQFKPPLPDPVYIEFDGLPYVLQNFPTWTEGGRNSVDDNRAVWIRNGDVYFYDFDTGTETIIPSEDPMYTPDIYDNYVVFTDNRDDITRVIMYDLNSGQEDVISVPAGGEMPEIEGNYVAYSSGKSIYYYDIATGQNQFVMETSFLHMKPSISGNKIVFHDRDSEDWTDYDVYVYELTDQNGTQNATRIRKPNGQYQPSISGNKIMYSDNTYSPSELIIHDLSTGQETRITTNSVQEQDYDIEGNWVTWSDARAGMVTDEMGNSFPDENIFMYDLSTGQELQVTSDSRRQIWPSVSDNRIIWIDDRNRLLQMFTFGLPIEDHGDQEDQGDDQEQGGYTIPADTSRFFFIPITNNSCEVNITLNPFGGPFKLSVNENSNVCGEEFKQQINVPEGQSGTISMLVGPGNYYAAVSGVGTFQIVKETRCFEAPMCSNCGIACSLGDQVFGSIDASEMPGLDTGPVLADGYITKPISPGLDIARSPRVSGNLVAFFGRGSSYNSTRLFLYDLQSDELMDIASFQTTGAYQEISGNYVVWDRPYTNRAIFLYDYETGVTTQLSPDDEYWGFPDIDGTDIVFRRSNSDANGIYLYDINTGEESLLIPGEYFSAPRISGNNVAVIDGSSSNVLVYHMDTERITTIYSGGWLQRAVDIDGNRVVWEDERNGQFNIYMYDLSTSTHTRISTTPSLGPKISGDQVIWADYRNGGWDTYSKDLVSGVESRISTTTNWANFGMDIDGDTITWHTNNPDKVMVRYPEGQFDEEEQEEEQDDEEQEEQDNQDNNIYNSRFYTHTLSDNNCAVVFSITSLGEGHALSINSQPNICTDTFDQSIFVSAGQTETVSQYLTAAGNYYVRVTGSGEFSLDRSYSCSQELECVSCPESCLLDGEAHGWLEGSATSLEENVTTNETNISESFPESEGVQYRHVAFTDGACELNLTLQSISGTITMDTKQQAASCSEPYDNSLTVAPGQTDMITVYHPDPGQYHMKFSGEGEYYVRETHFCGEDRTPPTLAFVNIPPIVNTTVVLAINASDYSGLATDCEVCFSALPGCAWQAGNPLYNYGDSSGMCHFVWDAATYPDGNYSITFRLSDTANNTANITGYSLKDSNPPGVYVLEMTNPTDAGGLAHLTVIANDTVGVSNVTAYLGGQAYSMTIVSPNVYEADLTAPANPGYYTVTIVAYDYVGLYGSTETELRVNEPIEWSSTIEMTREDSPDSMYAMSDSQGNRHLVYEDTRYDNPEIFYTKMNGFGRLEWYSTRLTNNFYNSNNPNIDVDGSGTSYVAWVDDRDANKEIYMSKLDSTGEFLIDNKRITTNVYNSEKPTILAGDTYVYLLMIDDRDGIPELYIKTLNTQGNTVYAARKISSGLRAVDYEAEYASSSIHVVWQDSSNNNHYLLLDNDANTIKNIPFGQGSYPAVGVSGGIYLGLITNNTIRITGVNGTSLGNSIDLNANPTATELDLVLGFQLHAVWQEEGEIVYAKIHRDLYELIDRNRMTYDAALSTNPKVTHLLRSVFWQSNGGNNQTVYLKTTEELETSKPVLSNIEVTEVNADTATIEWDTNEPATSTVHYGTGIPPDEEEARDFLKEHHSVTLRGLEPDTTYMSSVESEDILGNSALYTNGGNYYVFSTVPERFQPYLPTTLFGAVRFANNQSPVQGIPVTAAWTDAANESQETIAVTLTIEEALEMGQPDMVGYFMFNEGNVQAKAGTTITVSAPNDITEPDPYVPADPGGQSHEIIGGPIIVDASPPVVTIHSPIHATYPTQNINLRYSVDEEIEWARFSLNGGDFVTVTSMQGENIPITPVIGENDLILVARDIIGLEGESTVNFQVNDTVPPIVLMNQVDLPRGIIYLSAMVSDPTNELAQTCEVCISSDGTCDTEWSSQGVLNDFLPGDMDGACSFEWITQGYPDQTYTISFRIRDGTDNMGAGEPIEVVLDNTAPNQIEGVTVQAVPGETALQISWQASQVADIEYYNVYRADQSFSDISQAELRDSPDAQETEYLDETLISEQTYYYAVTGVDLRGNENNIVSSVAGTVADLTPPLVSVISPQLNTYDTFTLPLTVIGSEDVVECWYNLNGAGDVNINQSNGSITGIEGENYIFASCVDESNNLGISGTIIFYIDTRPPEPLEMVWVDSVPGADDLYIHWVRSGATDISHYNIYKSIEPFTHADAATKIMTSFADYFTDEGLESEAAFYYGVTPVDRSGYENKNVVPVWAQVPDYITPEPVTGVTVESIQGRYEIEISWDASTADDFDYYNIYRHASPGQLLTTIYSRSTTSYSDIDLENGKTYYYTVVAVDDAGNKDTNVPSVSGTAADLIDPEIDLISPVDKTYNTDTVHLRYVANEQVTACQYSLNSQQYQPFTSTITSGEGLNTVQMKCDDLSANTGFSNTVMYTVDTTSPPPTELTVASVPGEAKLLLTWTVGFLPSDFSYYRIYRSRNDFTSINDASMIGATDNGVLTFTNTGLNSETTYYYAVVGVDEVDNMLTEVDAVAGTVADVEPPNPILNLAVITVPGELVLDLEWGENQAEDFDHYNIYKLEHWFFDITELDPIAQVTLTTYQDVDLESDQILYYAVTAVDDSGNEDKDVSARTGHVSDITPPILTLVSPESILYNTPSIPLLYYGDEELGDCTYSLDSSEFVPATDVLIAGDGEHIVVLGCEDTSGNTGESEPITFEVDTIPPQDITGLRVTSIPKNSALQLNWDESLDTGLDHYNIYRLETEFTDISSMTAIVESIGNEYLDEGVFSEETYYYAITAVDMAGNEVDEVMSVEGVVADSIPPEITIISPENQKYTSEEVNLVYVVNEDVDWCTFSLNYGENHSVNGTTIMIVPEGHNLVTVQCMDMGENIGFTNRYFEVDLSPPAPIGGLNVVTIPGVTSLRLSWNPAPESDFDHYNIYRSDNDFDNVEAMTPIEEVVTASFTDPGLDSEGIYYYAITAVDIYGRENKDVFARDGQVADVTPPGPIHSLSLEMIEGESSMRLVWNQSNATDLEYYNIYRSLAVFEDISTMTPIKTTTDTSYVDVDLAEGRIHYYAVTGVDDDGNENPEVIATGGMPDDVTPPIVNVHDVGPRVAGLVVLSASVSDEGSGLAHSCAVCIEQGESCDAFTYDGVDNNFIQGANNGTCTYEWDTTGIDKTTYTYNFKAADLNNNTATGIEQQTEVINASESREQIISLQAGWNLISLPVIPADQSTSVVLSSIAGAYNRIYYYEPTTRLWQAYTPGRDIYDPDNTLIQLSIGKSYWIDMNSPAQLSVVGYPVAEYSQNLIPGWNFIGYPFLDQRESAVVFNSIKEDFHRIYSWNNALGKWDIYQTYPTVYQQNTLNNLQPGVGLVIDMKKHSTWTP